MSGGAAADEEDLMLMPLDNELCPCYGKHEDHLIFCPLWTASYKFIIQYMKHSSSFIVSTPTITVVWHNSLGDLYENRQYWENPSAFPARGTVVEMEVPKLGYVRNRAGQKVPAPIGPFRTVILNGEKFTANVANIRRADGKKRPYPDDLRYRPSAV
jgi:hypothetical protein